MYLWLSEDQAQALVAQARAEAPAEACGVIGGREGRAERIIPIANIAADPQRHYRLDDAALVRALFDLERAGLGLIAFYHTHPTGDALPSPADIQLATYRDTPYLIIGLRGGRPSLMAWRIGLGSVTPVEVHIGEGSPPHPAPFSEAQRTAVIISAAVAFVFMLILSVKLLPPAPPIP